MTMTEAIAQTHLDAWLAADLALAKNETYTISTPSGSRSLTRADGEVVDRQISKWQRVLQTLKAEAAGATNPTTKVATWSTRR